MFSLPRKKGGGCLVVVLVTGVVSLGGGGSFTNRFLTQPCGACLFNSWDSGNVGGNHAGPCAIYSLPICHAPRETQSHTGSVVPHQPVTRFDVTGGGQCGLLRAIDGRLFPIHLAVDGCPEHAKATHDPWEIVHRFHTGFVEKMATTSFQASGGSTRVGFGW